MPIKFNQIKTAYNAANEIWNTNDLISKCVFEEEKLKKEKNVLRSSPILNLFSTRLLENLRLLSIMLLRKFRTIEVRVMVRLEG